MPKIADMSGVNWQKLHKCGELQTVSNKFKLGKGNAEEVSVMLSGLSVTIDDVVLSMFKETFAYKMQLSPNASSIFPNA